MFSFLISLVLLVLGYFLYGKFVEKVFSPDPARKTPALEKADGVWKVSELEPDSEFYNAMTGGLIQAMEDINDMFESYMSSEIPKQISILFF